MPSPSPDLIPLEDLQPHPSLLGTELDLWRAAHENAVEMYNDMQVNSQHSSSYLRMWHRLVKALRALADRKGVRG